MNSSSDTRGRSLTGSLRSPIKATMIREARTDPVAFVRLLLAGAAWDPLPAIHRDLQNHLSAHRLALVELGRAPELRIKTVCASEAIAPWGCPPHVGIQNAPGKAPPSRSKFCPVMYPAWAEQRKAQAAPNSAGSPKRRAGIAC